MKKKRIMYITISGIVAISIAMVVFLNQPAFGRSPRGERLERIKKSSNYRDGQFQNLSPTEHLTSEKSRIGLMFSVLTHKIDGLKPKADLPAIKTDLTQFERAEDVLIWLGHSSLFMQLSGKRLLVDPVLFSASPVSFVNKPFKGANIYMPEDIPDIDYLIITHDHYDHLDYKTVKQLKGRVGKVICPLGVGEHFERWGFNKDSIIEMDWHENTVIDSGFTIHCLPARHFSGRGLSSNKTLWASFMLQPPLRNIYLSGDSGYDTHFPDIGQQFDIDLAILENGQYSENWKFIHTMPDELANVAKDLNAKRIMTVHNSKYALSQHPWKEPLENIASISERDSLNLLPPMIGEPMYLNNTLQVFEKWWENINLDKSEQTL